MNLLVASSLLLLLFQYTSHSHGFVLPSYAPLHFTRTCIRPTLQSLLLPKSALLASTSASSSSSPSLTDEIQANLNLLYRAAETKQEDSDAVFEALQQLEKQMRQVAKQNPSFSTEIYQQLTGRWRLVFTTGTAETQKRNNGNRINYFPLKAIQAFDTTVEPNTIENGIYLGDDWSLIQFSGTLDFDFTKCRLNFDFDTIRLFNGFWTVPLKRGEAASLGGTLRLGAKSNAENAKRGRPAFFNWISVDEKIATARGAGGGLALWKRI